MSPRAPDRWGAGLTWAGSSWIEWPGRALGAVVLAVAWIALAAAPHPAASQDLAAPDEILSLIEEVVGPPNTAARRGLEFELNSPNGRYREGDYAEFRVRAPDYDAFIYLDYYQIDGNVVHILPGPGGYGAVPRHEELVIGTPESGVSYEILPPFGRELLVLMAAPQPLFNGPRREFEFATVYLEDLRRGIARLEQSWPGQLAVIYRAIQTGPADAFVAEAPQTPARPEPRREPRGSVPAPIPLIVPRQPEPEPEPEPQVIQPAPEPRVVQPAPQPQVVQPAPAPRVAESRAEPRPQASEAELPPAPVADLTPSVAPSVTPSPAPQVAEAPVPQPAPEPAPLPAPSRATVPAAEAAPEPEPEPEPQQTAALPVPKLPAPETRPETRPEPRDMAAALRDKIGDLNKRVQLSPNDMVLVRELATTYRDHAQLMFDRGEYEKANLSLSMVMALDVTNADLVAFAENLKARITVRKTYEVGLTQVGLGQVALAYESFQDVLDLDPGNAEARKRMNELAPEVTELYHKEALSAARRQDLDRALEIWDKVLTISPDFEEAKLKRVEALRRKKRLEQLPTVQ